MLNIFLRFLLTTPRRLKPGLHTPIHASPLCERRAHFHSLSTVIHKYDDVCCAAFGLGLGATREHTRHGSVTGEQQRPKPKAAQPSGRQCFSSQTSWLAPYRPLVGMLVARASSGSKIPCRKRYRIYESQY